VVERIQHQLSRTLANQSETQVGVLLHSLLGKEEFVALAKRLTAILLLLQGRSPSEVASALKVSRAHANRLSHRLQAGEFAPITQRYTKTSLSWNDVSELAETVLRLGGVMPMRGDSLEDMMTGGRSDYRSKHKNNRSTRQIFQSNKTTDINDL
jgi:Trp operon repressor